MSARRLLVLNAGSSSLKYRVFDADDERVVANGMVDRIGEPGAPDYAAAIAQAIDAASEGDLVAIGHRVVHGGELFDRAVLVDAAVEQAIDELSALAPLHNPPALAGIRAAAATRPGIPQVAVFDTAFHATLSPAASSYAIDAELAAKHGVRRYGFHGTSYRYVAQQTALFLERDLTTLKLIVLHLGNGASAAAISGGRSVDTSMGLTPLEGLVMGTRSGDVDPAALLHLHRVAGLGFDELDTLLNRRSGLLGLSGSGDMRDVLRAAESGDARAGLALQVHAHRIRHYIGAYAAVLGGVDALVFTAGIGEHDPATRERVVEGLGFLGIRVDPEANRRGSGARRISPEGSAVEVLVIPTDEELEIARQTLAVIAG